MTGVRKRAVASNQGIQASTVTADVLAVGRNAAAHKQTTMCSQTEIHNLWQPVAEAIRAAPQEKQAEATAKLEDLKKEAAKGNTAEDTTLAKLVKGLVGLVPSAVSAIVSAFGTPILGGLAGPVTKFVLGELGEDTGKK